MIRYFVTLLFVASGGLVLLTADATQGRAAASPDNHADSGAMLAAYKLSTSLLSVNTDARQAAPVREQTTPVPPSRPVTDVYVDQFFFEPVTYLVAEGIVSGYSDSTFRPFNKASRAQLIKIVVNARGWKLTTGDGPHFSDVPTSHPFYDYIETAFNYHIISGYEDGTFRPEYEVTRAQTVKIVVQSQGLIFVGPTKPTFSDVPKSDPFYQEIEIARNRGIINGYADDSFRGGTSATRGQIATLVFLAGKAAESTAVRAATNSVIAAPSAAESVGEGTPTVDTDATRVLFAGSSITYAGSSVPSYRALAEEWIAANYAPSPFGFNSIAVSGANSWSNLFRLEAALTPAPKLVLFDDVNDGTDNLSVASLEALIRRTIAANSDVRLIGMLFFVVDDNSVDSNVNAAKNEKQIANFKKLADYYSFPVVDFHAKVQELVNTQGHHLNEYLRDAVHPTAAGHQVAFELLKPTLVSALEGEPAMGRPLPAHLFDRRTDYEQPPVRKYGTSYDKRTGTWTDEDTSTSSSEVGATITYSGVFRSVGSDRKDGRVNPAAEASIDGGPWVKMVLYQNGWEATLRPGYHTITFRLLSDTPFMIDQFWII